MRSFLQTRNTILNETVNTNNKQETHIRQHNTALGQWQNEQETDNTKQQINIFDNMNINMKNKQLKKTCLTTT